ncbi:hypothetical protein BT63DRAFT_430643 [Microthyrium microscopicum]|uniref:Uncharacterized protein n=1 Tax=Microthyrium microscopicum TaxID=703497 RepID=A0A6A6TTY3_9PEZI|nr:hypothetical protein BT63DRAFT_430643 [Microthyrium microscopicum]
MLDRTYFRYIAILTISVRVIVNVSLHFKPKNKTPKHVDFVTPHASLRQEKEALTTP